ncbi:MAG: alpha-E domain-containing protein, partial [Verrucomicrobiia bacterium]
NVNMHLALDADITRGDDPHRYWSPVINTLEDQELFYTLHEQASKETVLEYMTFTQQNPNSILSCLSFARENARTVREQISSEMWEQVNEMYLFIHSEAARAAFTNNPYDFYRSLIQGSYLFQGITDTTLSHGEGFDFIRFAKFLERGDYTSRILDVKYHLLLPSGEYVGGNVDTIQWMALLMSCSALEAYRKMYVGQIAPWKVAEFLVLNESFPRSILFCVTALDQALHSISGGQSSFNNEAERLSGSLRFFLAYNRVDDIIRQGLHEFLDQIQLRLAEIADAAMAIYCAEHATAQQQKSVL